MVFEGQTWTYQQLDEAANRVANSLRQLGIQKGDRVALFLPNVPAFIWSYLGILKMGGIAVSVSAMLKSDEVQFILRDCEAKVAVAAPELASQIVKDDLAYLQYLLIAWDEELSLPSREEGVLVLADLMAEASGEAKAIEMARDDRAAILYTSGTTGFPKGATLSHGNVMSNLYSLLHCYGIKPEDRLLLFLPLFHCFGQNAVLNPALAAGATVVLVRRFKPEEVLETIQKERITMFFGVPTVYIKLLKLNLNEQQLQWIRYYFSAAASLPPAIASQWEKRYHHNIYEGYGLTETAPCASYNHGLKYQPGSVGMPIDNVEMKVVDAEGNEPPPGEYGEIIVRGPNVMLGYWNRPEETQKILHDGWLHTGDIGYVDEDGYFYIVDRAKDMINMSGFNVYPAEVERVLYQHPAVAEAAVYGMPHPEQGEQVVARICLRNGWEISSADLQAFCQECLANYKVPQVIKFVESLPKNPTGKILKRVLRELETS
ncbi:long-chain fatty acid--CoA ligase [[Phormidium] sp. ETS-05]|uniref:class I adenylate-forming enzyme family protein n=1 Tax=[Phormidium] sp. ETS-05 TaxID=222819 RepID=UPI001E65D4BC